MTYSPFIQFLNILNYNSGIIIPDLGNGGCIPFTPLAYAGIISDAFLGNTGFIIEITLFRDSFIAITGLGNQYNSFRGKILYHRYGIATVTMFDAPFWLIAIVFHSACSVLTALSEPV